MATGWVKPNGTKTQNWDAPAPPAEHHLNIDEYPGADSWTCSALNLESDDNDVDIFYMTTLDDIEDNSITQIVVYTIGVRTGDTTPEIDVSFDNGVSWESGTGNEPECALPLAPRAEVTNTWGGLSYSKADLDNLLIKYIADVPDKDDSNTLDRVYAVITYTVPAVGYGHDFLGIPAANIDSIMGIPTANIDNICGL